MQLRLSPTCRISTRLDSRPTASTSDSSRSFRLLVTRRTFRVSKRDGGATFWWDPLGSTMLIFRTGIAAQLACIGTALRTVHWFVESLSGPNVYSGGSVRNHLRPTEWLTSPIGFEQPQDDGSSVIYSIVRLGRRSSSAIAKTRSVALVPC